MTDTVEISKHTHGEERDFVLPYTKRCAHTQLNALGIHLRKKGLSTMTLS